MMLEHTGRKTRAPRYVVLEVAGRVGPSGYVVTSGFGARGQWFRNIQADPRVRTYLGSHRPVAATAHVLGRDEAARMLAAYARAHPRPWAAPVPEHTLGTPIGGDGAALPLVVLGTTAPATAIRPGGAAG